ncbi:MAG: type II secretion system F family protein [Thermogutta sp.]|nr:type II secretion system F family protein [Thermogutta sp.]HOP76860.1 type II secretion system F family protein [Thermogutta sp.]HPU06010.1 type II secretion system F family protein [Thermogutta sp.]HQF14920.1 type II secretion system F family protein [Thermogutta sp.]
MPEFSYVAVDANGQRVTGTIAAATKREALTAIASRELYPLEVRSEAPARPLFSFGRRSVPAQAMAVVYGQLADLLRSGVPLLRALNIVKSQSVHPTLKEVLGEVARRVEDGMGLGDAMARFPGVFSEMASSMVRAGSEGGFLEEALYRVAEFTEATEDLRKRVKGAMAYPMFLIVIGSLLVSGLLIFLVPQFEGMFQNLRERNELPGLTEGLLAFSQFLQAWGIWVVVVIILGFFSVRAWLRSETGRRLWDRYVLKVPILGGIVLNFAVARFCRVLGTLLKNGVPILRALEIASEATGNVLLGEAVHKATKNISQGQRLAEPLAACKLFPPLVVEMIAVAEEANTLETVLLQIADSLERRTWRQLDVGVRLLEPILLLLVAMAVLVVVVALLLPVFKMSGAVG